MEEAARIITKAFGLCMTDRRAIQCPVTFSISYPPSRISPYEESRKWGIYYVVGLVLKCYFRVRPCLPYKAGFFLTEASGSPYITVQEYSTCPRREFRHAPIGPISKISSGMNRSLVREHDSSFISGYISILHRNAELP